ncbi:PREDICTED: uncharacterized protein LOC101299784 isoform 2 [Fragaria vesca subsp. vesca]
MEVHTQSLSGFATLQSKPPSPFSYSPNGVLHSRDFPTSELSPKCEAVSPKASEADALGGEGSESKAAVKLQKVYRSYRTRRRLADSAVVAEELWWQAIDYARLNHSTISFFNFLKPESVASRWKRFSLNASKVGKGLSKDAKAQQLAFQHWIEALDLKKCPRSELRQQCIRYLGPHERIHYEYVVADGQIIHSQTGELLDTNEGSKAKWIFVMSTTKKLYAGEKKKGVFHHSSFLAGGVTIAAGRLAVEHGILKSISAYSGHYRPTDDRLDSFLSFLKENGVNLDEVEIRKANEDSEKYDGKSNKGGTTFKFPTNSEAPTEPEIPEEAENTQVLESTDGPETKANYQRTLSGGLQSPRAEVPQNKILQRINSKKQAKSYQLGHQLSLKWSTGAGPRIGCVADYPVELRMQALEFVNLSPRSPPTPSYRRFAGLASPTSGLTSPTSISTSDINHGDLTSGD